MNYFLDFKKEIKTIIQKFSSNEFSFGDEKNDFENVISIMQSTIAERDAVISLLLNMDDEEIVVSISYLYNNALNDAVFINDLFKMSAFKFIAYEIVLYTLTNLFLLDKFNLVYTIISKKYYTFNYSQVEEVSFYYTFGIRMEHACNIKKMGVDSDDNCAVTKLIENRLNPDLASLFDLKSCDLLINDCAVLAEDDYIPFFINSTANIALAMIIVKRIASDDSIVLSLFNLKNKSELRQKLNDLGNIVVYKRMRIISHFVS